MTSLRDARAVMRLTADQTRTLLLDAGSDGEASRRLAEGIYDELRGIAQRLMRSERADHPLQATELVHEAFLRLADHPRLEDVPRTRFLVISAGEMRRVLIDYSRRRDSLKRGGEWKRLTLSDTVLGAGSMAVDPLALGDALDQLGALDARQLRVVELRFFAGMSMPQIAGVLQISLSAVEDLWYVARAWLRRALCEPPPEPR